MLKIGIILGSTRPGRNGEAVAKWVYGITQKRSDAEFELVDIQDFNLPLLDEPAPPSWGIRASQSVGCQKLARRWICLCLPRKHLRYFRRAPRLVFFSPSGITVAGFVS
jgi:hypothetical protein